MQYILEHSEYIQLIDKSKVREPIMKFSNALIKEISVTKQFGDSPEVSIRRKILEDAIHTLWAELGI